MIVVIGSDGGCHDSGPAPERQDRQVEAQHGEHEQKACQGVHRGVGGLMEDLAVGINEVNCLVRRQSSSSSSSSSIRK